MDALVVKGGQSIGVFVVLLSTRGCNDRDQCISQRVYVSTREREVEVGRTRCVVYHARPVRSFVQPFQLGVKGVKADSGRERHGQERYCTPRASLVGAKVSTGID
jgi:hypothetical protein